MSWPNVYNTSYFVSNTGTHHKIFFTPMSDRWAFGLEMKTDPSLVNDDNFEGSDIIGRWMLDG